MLIEAVVPCVNYDDFLRITLPNNRVVLPAITILTAPWDRRTADLAAEYDLKLIVTDAWHRGGPFNKGRALNEWLETIVSPKHNATWALVLDADVLLPKGHGIEVEDLDPAGLYSARRRMCEDYESFLKFAMGLRSLETFPLQIPLVKNGRVWGHRPTSNPAGLQGYMQLWCPLHGRGMKRFPETGTAGKYDVEFGLSFPQSGRSFLRNYEVLHLGRSRINWAGRISTRWGESEDHLQQGEARHE
jgi:hypothetical protein